VPVYGVYKEVFNSESEEWGGTGIGNPGEIKSKNEKEHELDYHIVLTLPPLGVCYYQLEKELPAPKNRGRKKKTAPKAEEAEVKAEEAKTEEPKAEEAKTEEVKAEEPKAEEAKAEQVFAINNHKSTIYSGLLTIRRRPVFKYK
jgi:1,4-alpha-glucan branching enzyme